MRTSWLIISGCITVYVPSKYYLFWHFSIAFRWHRRMDIKRSFCLLLSKPVQVNPSTFSFLPLSSSFIYHLSLFPGACLQLGPLFFTPPSLNFIENSCKINMLSFLKANLILSLHLSHLPPPLPLQTTSPLYLHFVLSSSCLRLSPRLPILSSNCLPCVSNPVFVPRHRRHSHSLCHCLSQAGAARHSCTLWLSLGIH